ncbi:hypothetical protein KJ708_00135 [bacterium]|nr:hypothetical protein [bacterium]MBU1917646.1 hypothetical protein [bacterium]
MKRKTINLTTNLSHITSVPQKEVKGIQKIVSKPANQKTISDNPINLCNDIVDCLLEQRNVLPLLLQIKHMLNFDVPLMARPTILQELNKILGALFYQYPYDCSLYKEAHGAMTLLNRQIDKHPQKVATTADQEWDELQKTVYLLSDWEDLIKQSKQSEVVHVDK